jgi:hypothetical protein
VPAAPERTPPDKATLRDPAAFIEGADKAPAAKKPDAPGAKPAPPKAAPGKPLEVTATSRRIRLNYEIRDVGPSGVASIELWATRDGKTWQRYSDEPPPASGPLVVHVAEEGRYGFTIVVKSGVGFSGRRPQPGDQPQVWVEVDETRPVVRQLDVRVGRGDDRGNLTVTWSASDAHLVARPITISTATGKDGPWTPIASDLENSGRYVWKMPRDVPYQFFVRVEAVDRAGNRGSEETSRPVAVDHAQPRGVILGVDADKAKADPAPERVHGGIQ